MNDHDDRRDLLSRSLHERSEVMAGSSVGLDEVRRGARGIRRRRRLAGGAAALVVLAIVVPLGLGERDVLQGVPPVAGSGTPLPSVSEPSTGPSPTPAVPGRDVRVSVDPATVPRGADPGVPYVLGRTVHYTAGATDELPRRYQALTPWGDGWVAARSARPEHLVELVGPDQRVAGRFTGDYDLAVDHDRRTVAWASTTPDLRLELQVLDADGVDRRPTTTLLPAYVNGLQPVGFVGPGRIAYTSSGGPTGAGVTRPGGTREIDGVDQVGATWEPGSLAAVKLRTSGSRECWAVMRIGTSAAGDRVRWRTCEHSLGHFSPDGRYLLAGSTGYTGIDDTQAVVVLAATGAPVATFTLTDGVPGGLLHSAAWEDDTHLLAQVRTGDRWRLVRLGIDGSVQQATSADPSRSGESPFTLLSQP